MPDRDRTILIVEDEPLIRIDLADTVMDMGYSVLEAGNADEAVRLLVEHKGIIAVITDVDMPGSMDGRKLAELVYSRWPACVLIVVSGQRKLTQADLPQGARFLAKPLQVPLLDRVMGELGLRPY